MPLSSDSASLNFGAFGPVITPAATDQFIVEQADGVQRIETRAQVHALEVGEHLILPQVAEPATPTLAFGDGDSGFYESSDDTIVIALVGGARFNFGVVGGQGAISSNISGSGPQIFFGVTSSTIPGYRFQGDIDTGIGHAAADQLSLIAGGVQVANLTESAGTVQLIVPLQNDAANPSIAFGDGDTGFYESTDDVLVVSIGGTSSWEFNASALRATPNGSSLLRVLPSDVVPSVTPNRFDANTGIGWRVADVGVLVAGGVNAMEFGEAGAAPLIGFYGTAAIAKQLGVAVTAAGIHAALVALGLIT